MLEILLGQIPEAIFFALFMIYTKQLKEKRILFIVLMIAEYLLCMYSFPFSIWSHILIFIMTYLTLKILYKEKAQIIDIFTLGIASIILILLNVICVPFKNINFILYVCLVRILMIIFLIVFKNKLYKVQNIYKKIWNRNNKPNKKIKSLTFRSLNLVIFNIMFYIINIGMIFAIYHNSIKK